MGFIIWALMCVSAFFLFKFGFKFFNKVDAFKGYDSERWPVISGIQSDKRRKKLALVICFIPVIGFSVAVIFFLLSIVFTVNIEDIFDK